MSLLAAAWLYSGPNRTGSYDLTGLGVGDRYTAVSHAELDAHNLVNSVASGQLTCSAADLNLVLFDQADYSGHFFQVSKRREDGDATFWHVGPTQSALVIASRNSGSSENRFSFVDMFRESWDTFLDPQLPQISVAVNGVSLGTVRVSREGEPLLTWRMFPEGDQWLDRHQVYLRVHQPLHVHMPWYWSDYSASADYHIVLFTTGDHTLRAWVADNEWWVEGGALSSTIGDLLGRAVSAGMAPLQKNLNDKLKMADAFGAINDVFYLPGRQLTPIGTDVFSGNTADDVTIVVVS